MLALVSIGKKIFLRLSSLPILDVGLDDSHRRASIALGLLSLAQYLHGLYSTPLVFCLCPTSVHSPPFAPLLS